jgi:hypothetical protein
MTKKLAAITMVYNEPEYLPIWCKYYGAEVGPEHCYIVDHGTNDGSTENCDGFNVIRIPRSPKDNVKRTRFISNFCSNLLEWYDAIVHTDVDEIVVPGPDHFPGLKGYVESFSGGVINAIGFDVHHIPLEEEKLDLSQPILRQRKWLRFASCMCKPVLTTQPIVWASGFHSADAAIRFDSLHLFHLRYFDLDLALARLRRTRSMAWSSDNAGLHQRMDDQAFSDLMHRIARLPKTEGITLRPQESPVSDYIARVLQTEKPHSAGTYNMDIHIFGDHLLKVPPRFAEIF